MDDNNILFSLSPQYRFSSPKYDNNGDYDYDAIETQTPKNKDLKKNKTKKRSKNNVSVTGSQSVKKVSKKENKKENKKKYEAFLKAIEENNPFKDSLETEEEKKIRESIINLPDVSDVVLIYEPEYKPVRDVGLEVASEEQLKESYERIQNTSLTSTKSRDETVVVDKNIATNVSNTVEINDISSSNNFVNKSKTSIDFQDKPIEIVEESQVKEDSNETDESSIFIDYTNILEKDKNKVVDVLNSGNSTSQKSNDSLVFLHLENKSTLDQKEIQNEKENKSKRLSERRRLSFVSHKKPRRNVPIRCVETVANNFNESIDFFQRTSILDSSKTVNETGNSEVVEINETLPVKRKSIGDDYPGSPKKVLPLNRQDDTFEMSRFFLDTTQEDVCLSLMTIDNMLEIVKQEKLSTFRKLFPPKIEKIGEGCFGEVYSSKQSDGRNIVYKVTPFEPDASKKTIVNGDILKGCHELTVEYIVTSELSKLSEMSTFSCDNFVKLYKTIIVRGVYPKILLDAWQRYKKNNEVFNDNPSKYAKTTNHYMVFELEDGGIELEKCKHLTKEQGYSIIFQLIHCLRIAEEMLKFEHRDLHESNILIQEIEKDIDIDYTYCMRKYKIKSFGVKIKIIDYSLSRLTLNNEKYYLDLEKIEGIFNDNADSNSFQAIYSEMRKLIKKDWSKFCSKNNLLWIIYHVKRLYSCKIIKDENFLKYFVDDVSKMNCLEELYNDIQFIEFQKTFIV